MLRGRFGDSSGRPFIEGRLLLPRLRIQTNISFLVDTGADTTVLLPADCLKMGIDYDDLVESPSTSVGIGGVSQNYAERALILFTEPGKAIHAYELTIEIVDPDSYLMDIPSLLGRDVLNQWRMRYYPTTQYLGFDVVSADLSAPI
jgi:hypothetical protein